MREFRTIKRCKKPRKEQALIYYTCINYHKADKKHGIRSTGYALPRAEHTQMRSGIC